MTNQLDTNAQVIAVFRANGGEVPAPYPDPPPMLLVHTIGARSGKEHVVPMRCLPDGDTLYIFGSACGSDRHPDWYYNLIANPDITIEKGTEIIPVRATETVGAERETGICQACRQISGLRGVRAQNRAENPGHSA